MTAATVTVTAAEAAEPTQKPGTLGPIRGVTLTAGDIAAAEQAWTDVMGYRVVQTGRISGETASSWGAPAVEGRPFVVLGPASGEPTFLRFVEQAPPAEAPDDHGWGWNTTEITVQDVDRLYERLKTSPFTVTNPPKGVPTYSYLKAMQAVGPAGERLNLTCITEPRPDLAAATSFVGRCFIVVQGGPDLPATLRFFETTFGAVPSAIRQLPTIQLAVVPLGDGAKIEADQSPSGATARKRPEGGLPPGIAVVTFSCSSFQRHTSLFLTPAHAAGLEPFKGRPAATILGPAGELIELMDA